VCPAGGAAIKRLADDAARGDTTLARNLADVA